MTWAPPPELIGKEGALIRDMPAIMASLCEEASMVAFGHNDVVTDNAYFVRAGKGPTTLPSAGASEELGIKSFGLFDWQQSSVNSVGQEWAWNFHWLPPEFLTVMREVRQLRFEERPEYGKYRALLRKAQSSNE